MPFGPTYFPTKGVCIYCRADSNLTDEHIVPFALGGQHVLREASCHACAKITSKFELKVARDLWGDARTSFNAQSRRKKNRWTSISMRDVNNPGNSFNVPASEYPAGFVFYKMGLPGILQGLPEDVDVSSQWTFLIVDDDKRRNEFLKKQTSKLVLQFRHVPQEFGQLLCKIAYGQLLTTCGLDDFGPLCLPYIMGQKVNVSHIVGGTFGAVSPDPSAGYRLNTTGLIASPTKMLLIVTIRLYAKTHAPEYQVVGGEVNGVENISKFIEKFALVAAWSLRFIH
jgi:hypothetical protein